MNFKILEHLFSVIRFILICFILYHIIQLRIDISDLREDLGDTRKIL